MTSQLSSSKSIIARGIFDDLTSFEELEMRISKLGDINTKVLGDAFEIFIEGYLATQSKLLMEENWVVGNLPLEVRNEMNLPNDGTGIDGIFRDRNGVLVPYQVKFRSNRPKLTYGEVSSFFGLTERAKDRIIFTNCNEIAVHAESRDAVRTVRGYDFDELTKEDFEAIASWIKGKPVVIERPTPRPYQADALNQICGALEKHDRATAVMACGTGKTLVALWAVERLKPQTVLVLVPSLTLVQQTLDEWSHHNSWGKRFSYICVCSDPSVAGNDDIQLNNVDVTFPVSTDPEQVKAFMDHNPDQVKVVFSTYQSSKVVAEAVKNGSPFDVGVFDEAHKTTGPKGGLFAHALSDDNLRIKKRLFLTATPRHYDIRKRNKEGDFKVISMDDEAVYGPRAYTLTFGAAAKQGIICDYKVVISVTDSAEIDQFALTHGITLVEGDQIGAKWVAGQIAMKKAIEKTSAKRAITFHSRVIMAEEFSSDTARGINYYLDGFKVYHANGKQKSSDRMQTLKAFRDAPKAIITNARCLTEGIDIPAVDMVAFVDPRQSRVDIAQAAGRAMRKPRGSDKTTGYVVIPLFLERTADETLEEALERSDFKSVASVLNAMREQDEDLVEIIQTLRQAKGRGEVFNPKALADKIDVLGPSIDLAELRESIYAEVVDSLGFSWDESIGLLQTYHEANGHSNVPLRYKTSSGYKLGGWVSTQRRNRDNMSEERMRRLEGIGFAWDPFEQQWGEGFEALKLYHETEGHCNVPRTFETTSRYRLGQWTHHQRRYLDNMSEERIQRLNDIGFAWEPTNELWEDGFATLKSYYETEGHCNVPIETLTSAGYKLGKWVSTQRLKGDNMSEERMQRLNDIGFVWDPLEQQWEERFADLKSYHVDNGHCNVTPETLTTVEYNWVISQRLKRDNMSEERVQRLNDIGFVWDPLEQQWEVGFVALKSYLEAEGHCNVPQNYKTASEYSLGYWVSTQRLKRDNMSEERVQRLDDFGFVWDVNSQQWEERFASLKSYYEDNSHCLVPNRYETASGYRLDNWVKTQRSTRDTLSEERVRRLNEIGFVWDLLNEKWENAFVALKSYLEAEGNCKVPQNYKTTSGYALGTWVGNQRKKRDIMSEEKVQRLNDIGFIW